MKLCYFVKSAFSLVGFFFFGIEALFYSVGFFLSCLVVCFCGLPLHFDGFGCYGEKHCSQRFYLLFIRCALLC